MNSNISASALAYVNRGWMPVPLYGIDENPTSITCGRCQCATDCGKSAGKHPIFTAWQSRDWRGWDGWSRHVGNVGIATGSVSGFWVLDYDPDTAGEGASPAVVLVRQLAAGSAHVRTGGGGLHWRFAMPDFPVTNARGRLPKGLDVRGNGGQVVAPPSVSGKGPYVELRGGLAVDTAPSWLLDLIRPEDPKPLEASMPVGSSSSAGLPTGSDREQRYAVAALQRECEEYAQLDDGRRGDAAWHLACRAVELMNLGRLQPDDVRNMVMGAIEYARLNGPPGGLAGAEALRLWDRARAEVGNRPAVIAGPDPIAAGAMPDGYALPFSSAPQVGAASLNPTSPGAVASAGSPSTPTAGAASSLPPMTDAGAVGQRSGDPAPAPASDPPSDPFELAVRRAAWDITVREEARRRIDAARAGARPPLELELITGTQLDGIADPVPLVDGYLFADSLARVNGRPGQGKSFVAVDIGCSVATGTPWAGRKAVQGEAFLLVAEGVSGVRRRVRAWERHHGVKVGDALVLFPRAVQVGGPEWPAFLALAAARRPALIVLDTQARVTVGRKENDAGDMGEVVDGLEALRAATGACVLAVHHAGKADDAGGRGSNAMEGAMTSEFGVTKVGPVLTLRTTKQKDVDQPGPLLFDLAPVQLDRDLGDGLSEPDPVPAAVPVWRDPAAVSDVAPVDIGKARQRALWTVIHGTHSADGGTRAEIRATFKDHPIVRELKPDSLRQAWARSWAGLVRLGLIAKRGERFRVVEVTDQSDDGVLTPNPGIDDGDVGQLGPSWTLWTPDDEGSSGQ